MNNEKQHKIELTQTLPKAYRTTDFEFAAFLMAQRDTDGQLLAEVIDIRPYQQRIPKHAPERGVRYAFYLTARNPALGDRVVEIFHKLRYDYTNQRCFVEPLALSGARRQLRAMLEQHRASRGANDE